eukprot:CAMPEP_0184039668 /NCGR_PEP_ID=MMETSP0955-20130417/54021_1 /TAXON_ID=627963 /ORGANISM="Aplanochytrium sp, Strain PBS07" /LENGTH=152 /DNA_ID=CAMNT_0026329009 /DNA_START=77 /DNA_END=536 /DNA_ORIENTATION=-
MSNKSNDSKELLFFENRKLSFSIGPKSIDESQSKLEESTPSTSKNPFDSKAVVKYFELIESKQYDEKALHDLFFNGCTENLELNPSVKNLENFEDVGSKCPKLTFREKEEAVLKKEMARDYTSASNTQDLINAVLFALKYFANIRLDLWFRA